MNASAADGMGAEVAGEPIFNFFSISLIEIMFIGASAGVELILLFLILIGVLSGKYEERSIVKSCVYFVRKNSGREACGTLEEPKVS